MIWLSRICFSFGCALIACGATVSGRIELRDSRDARVRSKSDYSGVVVWLTPAHGDPPALAPRRARIAQRNKTFVPHVVAIPVGGSVEFPNFDPIFHNAFSNYSGQLFDVGLYPPGTSRTVKFTRPGVVRVFCNIHSSMSAVVVVLATPYFAVTARDGSYTIPNVPPGDYTMSVFHERAVEAALDRLSRRIVVEGDAVTPPPVIISEAGYLPIPHKDKFGREYGPEPDDRGVYPGARK